MNIAISNNNTNSSICLNQATANFQTNVSTDISNHNFYKSAPASNQPVAIRIGFYDILNTIGHGNFSVCKLAAHVNTKELVAIKCIEKKSLDSYHLARLDREIEIMRSLDHPHIIKLIKVMVSKSMLFLVSEYAQNGELFDYILKNGAMSEKMACEKFCQIISAVEYCHAKNIVHRDLKTENLLLDSRMNIKLADFGFANYYDLTNPLKTFCGSPPYAAPEIFCGKKYYGPEIDIWSLGVILYILVTGSLPFDSKNIQNLKQAVLACKYRIPYYISKDCESLLGHMLVVNPSKRYKLHQIKLNRWIKTNSSYYYYVFKNSKNSAVDITNSTNNNSEHQQQQQQQQLVLAKAKSMLNKRFNRISNRFKSKSFKVVNNNKKSKAATDSGEGETNNDTEMRRGFKPPNGQLNLSSISLPIYSFSSTLVAASSSSSSKSTTNLRNLDSRKSKEHPQPQLNKTLDQSLRLKLDTSSALDQLAEMSLGGSASATTAAQSELKTSTIPKPTSAASVIPTINSALVAIQKINEKILAQKMLQLKANNQPMSATSSSNAFNNSSLSSSSTSASSQCNPHANNVAYHLKCNAFAKIVSNSSSMDDEGVESDLSLCTTATSSFSTDLFSTSINSSIPLATSSFDTTHLSWSANHSHSRQKSFLNYLNQQQSADSGQHMSVNNNIQHENTISSNSSINSNASSSNHNGYSNSATSDAARSNVTNGYCQKLLNLKRSIINNNNNNLSSTEVANKKKPHHVNDLKQIKRELKLLMQNNKPMSVCNSSNCILKENCQTNSDSNNNESNNRDKNNNSTSTMIHSNNQLNNSYYPSVTSLLSESIFQKYKQFIFFKNSKKNNTPTGDSEASAQPPTAYHHYHYNGNTKIDENIKGSTQAVSSKRQLANVGINLNLANKTGTNLVKCKKSFLIRQRSSSLTDFNKINVNVVNNKISTKTSVQANNSNLARSINKSFNCKLKLYRKYSLKN